MGVDVLLIGGDGLVGSHLLTALRGRDVVVTTRSGRGGARALDVTDHVALRELVRDAHPRTVVLAAADANVERCETDPLGSAAVNVGATEAGAAGAAAVGARLVVFSSEYVFPGGDGRYCEEEPVGPINEYGRQKVAVERAARRVERSLVVRTSGVFGWETACKNFVCRGVRLMRRGQSLFTPEDQVITPTYAPDLAGAVVELVDRGTDGIVHVAGPTTVARAWFGRAVARAFGLDEGLVRGVPSSAMGYRAQRPVDCGLDDGKLRQLLGRSLRAPEAALAAMRDAELVTSPERPAPER